MADIFISYSTQSESRAFANRLHDALSAAGFDVWLDRHDLTQGEAWWKNIEAAITATPTIVFVVSNASLSSEYCNKEIALARELGNRIFPVIFEEPDERVFLVKWFTKPWEEQARDNWKALQAIQRSDFTHPAEFENRIKVLIDHIHRDSDLAVLHTYLSQRAKEWEHNDKDASSVLRGEELDKADQLLERLRTRSDSQFALSPLLREYFEASHGQAKRSQRLRQATYLLIATVVASIIILAVVGYITQAMIDDANTEVDQIQLTSEALTDNIKVRNAEYEVSQSMQAYATDDYDGALDHALASLEGYPTTILSNNSWQALFQAMNAPVVEQYRLEGEVLLRGGSVHENTAPWSPDKTHLITWAADGIGQCWDIATGTIINGLDITAVPTLLTWAHNSEQFLVATNDGAVRVFDADDCQQTHLLSHAIESDVRVFVYVASWSFDDALIVTHDNLGVWLWDVNTGNLLGQLNDDPSATVSWARQSHRLFIGLESLDSASGEIWDADSLNFLMSLPHVHRPSANWSPDDEWLLSWSHHGEAYVWDGQTGEMIASVFPLPARDLWGGEWANTGDRFATVGLSSAQINVADDPTMPVKLEQDGGATDSQWNRDGTRLLAWSASGAVYLWTVEGNKMLRFYHDEAVSGALFNQAETQVLSWAADNTIRITDITQERSIVTLTAPLGVSQVNWDADETHLLVSYVDGSVGIWTLQARIPHAGSFQPPIWNHDHTRLVTWNADNQLTIWAIPLGIPLSTIDIPGASGVFVVGGAWNADETRLAVWGDQVWIFDTATGDLIETFPSEIYVSQAEWHPDGKRLLVLSDLVQVWDTEKGTLLYTLDHQQFVLDGSDYAPIWQTAWNATGDYLYTWTNDTTLEMDATIYVWRASDGSYMMPLWSYEPFRGVAWSDDGIYLVGWTDAGQIHMLDIVAEERLAPIAFDPFACPVAFDRIQSLLALCVRDTLQIWDIKTQTVVSESAYPFNTDDAVSLAFSEHRDVLFIDSFSAGTIIWDYRTQTVVASLLGGGLVTPTDNPDGSLLATVSEDRVWVWDYADTERAIVLPELGSIQGLYWSQDGTQLVVNSGDGMIESFITVWQVDLESLYQNAPSRRQEMPVLQ